MSPVLTGTDKIQRAASNGTLIRHMEAKTKSFKIAERWLRLDAEVKCQDGLLEECGCSYDFPLSAHTLQRFLIRTQWKEVFLKAYDYPREAPPMFSINQSRGASL